MIKHLYGKIEYLSPFINGQVSLRFSDLSHYSRLENNLMRDDELTKKFEINPSEAKIFINDKQLNPADIVGNISVSVSVINCYCLCLSNRKNDRELFDKFKANVCLEIDIGALVETLHNSLRAFPGIKIEHAKVTYFKPTEPIPTTDQLDLDFYKPEFFRHESEYRVVIRLPENNRSFKTTEGLTVPFFISGESMHLSISSKDSSFNNNYLRGIYQPTAAENG